MHVSDEQFAEQLISLSQDMVSCAQAGEWEKVSTLDRLRREVLDNMQLRGASMQRCTSRQIAQLTSLNDELLQLAIKDRQQSLDAYHQFKGNKRVTASYQWTQQQG
jgi:hypothetical protein